MRRSCLRQLIAAICLLVGSSLWAQNSEPLKPLPGHAGYGWDNASNRWQLTAVDLKAQVDTVSPVVRAQRNARWKWSLEMLSHVSMNPAFVDDTRPELDSATHSSTGYVWAIATFESFHVYAIDPAYHLLYTEINLRIEKVIRASEDLHLTAGSLIDVGSSGGKVKTPTGEINSFLLEPERYAYQPGHKYLVQLLPTGTSSGNPFVNNPTAVMGTDFADGQKWDVSSGTVEPDDRIETARAGRGESKLKGMTVDEAVSYLESALPNEPNTTGKSR